jgi:polyphosphate kinase 2 (PPK2 family)
MRDMGRLPNRHHVYRRRAMPELKNEKNSVRSGQSNGVREHTKAPEQMKNKEYEKELKLLHIELVKLQEWVVQTGAKVCVIFEGRDGAGKGGTIKAITERVSPRIFRVIALPAPTDREKSQMYIQRYLPHLPAAGEIILFDRSWYNRAGVERVMGFCTDEQVQNFFKAVPLIEHAIIQSGIIFLKYWLTPSRSAHYRRTEDLETVADGSAVVQPLV